MIRLSLKQSYMAKNKRAVVFRTQATTARSSPGRDTFECDQGHVTKNQQITMIVLLSESLCI